MIRLTDAYAIHFYFIAIIKTCSLEDQSIIFSKQQLDHHEEPNGDYKVSKDKHNGVSQSELSTILSVDMQQEQLVIWIMHVNRGRDFMVDSSSSFFSLCTFWELLQF